MQYTYLEKLLSHGLCVVVGKDGKFCIVTPFADPDNNQSRSCWENSIEKCKEGLFISYYEQRQVKEKCPDWTLVDCYYPTFKPFEIGQRVKVIKTGEEGKIVVLFDDDIGIRYQVQINRKNNFSSVFMHTKLLPLPDETPITLSNEELLQEVKRRGLTTMGEIIKG